MIKIETNTLEEAYQQATKELKCSAADVHLEIIQYPRKVFGLFRKKAIVFAYKEQMMITTLQSEGTQQPTQEALPYNDSHDHSDTATSKPSKSTPTNTAKKSPPITPTKKSAPPIVPIKSKNDQDSNDKSVDTISTANRPQGTPLTDTPPVVSRKAYNKKKNLTNTLLEDFYLAPSKDFSNKLLTKDQLQSIKVDTISEIKKEIEQTFLLEGFDYQLIEISMYNDKTIYIKFDGKDISILIGKQGYRYKALYHLLFAWIYGKYRLSVHLEVGQFLEKQQRVIRRQLGNFAKRVEEIGYGKTLPIEEAFIHIGLEYLRERCPDKHIINKKDAKGNSYIKVEEFRSKK